MIGILGGTFDPVHHGHLRLALECRERLQLERVNLVPACVPPHRPEPEASPQQRLRMLQLAVENSAGLRADDREIRRGGVSYTVATLESLREKYPDLSLCLILGTDAFRFLHTWHRWTLLPDYAHIIVVERPGSDAQIQAPEIRQLLSERVTSDPEQLHRSPAGRIFRVDLPVLDISSTRIRHGVAAGRDPRYLTPDNVIAYMKEHRLYHGMA